MAQTPTPTPKHSRRLLKIALLVVLSIIVSLLSIELFIRSQYATLPPSLQFSLYTVRLTPFTDARLGGPLLLREHDPEYGTTVFPVRLPRELGARINAPYNITTYRWWDDRLAFRSPQPDKFEVVALGDSFTFCWVDDGLCWTDVLGQEIGAQVTNTGQPGTGAVSQMRRYFNYINNPARNMAQPRLVIWQFYVNDYYDDYQLSLLDGTNTLPPEPGAAPPGAFRAWMREVSALFVVAENASNLSRDQKLYTAPFTVKTDTIDLAFGHPFVHLIADATDPRNLEGALKSDDAILKVRDAVEKTGGKFMIVAIPTKEVVYRAITEPKMGKAEVDAFEGTRVRLFAFCQARRLTCFDPLPALESQARRQLYYREDTHLNVAGNRVLAEALAQFLKDQGMVK
jgi:hypothetical protein